MRFARLNADKIRRCPTWSGPALKGPNPKYEDECHEGFIPIKQAPLWKFRFFQCPECKVITLPYYVTSLSPSFIHYRLTRRFK